MPTLTRPAAVPERTKPVPSGTALIRSAHPRANRPALATSQRRATVVALVTVTVANRQRSTVITRGGIDLEMLELLVYAFGGQFLHRQTSATCHGLRGGCATPSVPT